MAEPAAPLNPPPIPIDQRIARRVVRPLRHTPVTPNMLTCVGLAVGLTAAWLFAQGVPHLTHWAGALFMLAIWIDHWDGELARLTGRTSRFGHYFDHAVSLANYVSNFVGIGIGLGAAALGGWAIPLGILAGVAVATIFGVRLLVELTQGRAAVKQPIRAGFETEDTMYILGPVAWAGLLEPFILAAGIGAPLFLVYVIRRALRPRRP
ncbi:MAG: CDP-alcohol phosphatidyltransferase family protein [Alphaproteobacteria bacterium]|nr:CDP-alcohol phosphatidyltransferase family protein [Alphaproteobacteria bacterium]